MKERVETEMGERCLLPIKQVLGNKAENKELSFVMNDGNNLHLVHAVVVCIWQTKDFEKKTFQFPLQHCSVTL